MLVGDIVRLTAARSPHRTAVVSDSRRSTYQQLLGRCEDLAAALRSVAEPGSRVAVLAENVPEYIEAYYGVPMAGMVLTFINYRLHPREMAWILRDCDAAVLIVERGYLDAVEPLVRSETSVGIVVSIGEGAPAGTVAYEDFLAGRRRRQRPRRQRRRARLRRTRPGCCTRAARPASRRAPSSPTAISWPQP